MMIDRIGGSGGISEQESVSDEADALKAFNDAWQATPSDLTHINPIHVQQPQPNPVDIGSALTNIFNVLFQLVSLIEQLAPRQPVAQPPVATTLAIGEEDGGFPIGGAPFTSAAIGEEDGGFPIGPPVATSLAIGEEDGGFPIGGAPFTSAAIGEEDGGISPEPPVATTLAIGEEDGGVQIGGAEFTSAALGEEEGGFPIADFPFTVASIGKEDRAPELFRAQATSAMVGEEDAPTMGGAFFTSLAIGEEG